MSSSSCCDTEITSSGTGAAGATTTTTDAATAIVDSHTALHWHMDEMEKKKALPFHVDHGRVSIFVDRSSRWN